MRVRVTLNCQVKPDQLEVLLPFLEKKLPNVRGFIGCMSVTVYFDKEASEMLLEEEWLSIEYHQTYIKHIESNGILGELASYLASVPVIKYFQKADL
ncbi:antibiotic biosynthesis monooxygenase [Pseudoalteromonas sp. NBT06-2]|uniref:putative quinol monooxygenase n=1 Tax=Pseudoalteromonas sp. NBT06-2 TaxID=2025950 RepID=UPI000BA53209|nr:antibiotic biosynthesis monooxygenase [Pseudoalteromonas sp. NBT06-2]PAJ76254.1 antibiotic biosynthesis monooxygenase [Pseudoalteromonas sp. NBT06-2]